MSQVYPESFLRCMNPADRAALGKGGMTAAEAREKWARGEENKLQGVIANFLNLKEVYFETDRMDRRTSGKKGRPDFRICYRGRWIAVECKAEGGKLKAEQEQALARIRKNGGIAIVAFGLPAVPAALRGRLLPGGREWPEAFRARAHGSRRGRTGGDLQSTERKAKRTTMSENNRNLESDAAANSGSPQRLVRDPKI